MQAEFVKHVFAKVTLCMHVSYKNSENCEDKLSLIFKCNEPLFEKKKKGQAQASAVVQLWQVRDPFSGELMNVFHFSVQMLYICFLTKGRLHLFSSKSGRC